jgi:hypothetical protein
MFIDLFEHISTLPEADPALAAFVPVAQSVVAAILQRGMCPASWRRWMSSAKNHHLQGVRLNLTEILTAFPPAFLSSIALPAALNSMTTGYNILSQGDENGWRPLEAGSWLLGDMADYLPVSAVEREAAREATAMLAPVVNSMVETFRTTNKLSQEPYRVLHSAVSMYSGLADREGLLSSEDTTSWIGTIFAVLAIPALAGKTAANLKLICKSTVSNGLVPVLPEMVAAVQGAGLAGLDLELAVEGIAAVVAKAPKDTALPVIRSVLELLLQRVANGLQTREQGLESLKEAMAQLSGFLRGLGTAVDGSLEDVVDLTGDKEVVVFESSKKYVRAGETINTAHDEELARALRDPDSTMLVGGTWQMVEKIGEMLSGWRKIGRAEEEIVEVSFVRLSLHSLPTFTNLCSSDRHTAPSFWCCFGDLRLPCLLLSVTGSSSPTLSRTFSRFSPIPITYINWQLAGSTTDHLLSFCRHPRHKTRFRFCRRRPRRPTGSSVLRMESDTTQT